MKSGKKYFATIEFNEELNEFIKKYLCVICRDRKIVKIKN
tara:strand:- start:514 stop:633 length:120 start_codon:yes stop_codon:yes gene_type:complete